MNTTYVCQPVLIISTSDKKYRVVVSFKVLTKLYCVIKNAGHVDLSIYTYIRSSNSILSPLTLLVTVSIIAGNGRLALSKHWLSQVAFTNNHFTNTAEIFFCCFTLSVQFCG